MAVAMKTAGFRLLRFALFSWLLLFSAHVVPSGRLLTGNPDNYLQLLKQMLPGDTLQLIEGEYSQGLPIHDLTGRPSEPIIITGSLNERQSVFLGRSGVNTVSIIDSGYVVVKNLVIDGQGHPIDAVKAEGHANWAHHITLENLLIRGHGNNQQTVGISTKCPAWGWIIRGNEIIGAGTGMYLGDSDGSAPFVAGLIEKNLISDTIGYNLQIKHQVSRPEIPDMPKGENVTIIRNNVFSKISGGSESVMARPNVLVGHWPLTGPGVNDRYLIYGNFFYQNPHEALFQGEGNIALYNNLFVNISGDAIHIQPHNDLPRKIDVFNNTILSSVAGITIRQKDSELNPQQQVVQGNLVFAEQPIVGGLAKENITWPMYDVEDYLENPFGPLGSISLYPKPGKLLPVEIDLNTLNHFTDSDKDFDGQPRINRLPGAYDRPANHMRLLPEPEHRSVRSVTRPAL